MKTNKLMRFCALLLILMLGVGLFGCGTGNNSGNPQDNNGLPSDSPEYGNTVGKLCFPADLPTYEGDTFNVEDNRGKIIVINFWGEWCGYCTEELPAFDRIANEYANDITVVAVHSVTGKDKGQPYVEQNFANSKIIFADDQQSSVTYYSLLGGQGSYPRTVILDKTGVIAYARDGALTYDALKGLIDGVLTPDTPTEAPTNVPTDAPTNTPTDAPTEKPTENQYTYGYEVGDICFGASLSTYKGTEFNPANNSGKITVIVFWNAENDDSLSQLSYVDRIAELYPDNVSVVAVHTAEGKEAGKTFVEENYASSLVIFADELSHDYSYFNLLGGTDTYPRIVVTNGLGIIQYTKDGLAQYDAIWLAIQNIFYPSNDPTDASTDAPTESPTSAPTDTPTEAPTEGSTEKQYSYGNQVGNICYGATLTDYSGKEVNPAANIGKVTVINFWGTWCSWCLYELPFFDQIATEYADNVTVIAVHSLSGKDDGKPYVDENYADSKIIFVDDISEGELTYYTLLGGIGSYPRTVILDENGVITYSKDGAMTYEALKQLVDRALEGYKEPEELPVEVPDYVDASEIPTEGSVDTSITGEGTEIDMTKVAEQVDSFEYSDFALSITQTDYVVIRVKDAGDIVIALRSDIAPETVENFKKLVSEGFYNGMIFHRVIEDFMIQGGGYLENGNYKTAESITGEFESNGHENKLKHIAGVISMARATDPNSASSQFFIVHKTSSHLDGNYAAFGYVLAGQNVVDRIARVAVSGSYYQPTTNVVIEEIFFVAPIHGTNVGMPQV